MRVFVAGSGGYIGIPLCWFLAKGGHEVIAFDRYFFGRKPTGDRITIFTGDIRDVTVSDLEGADAVVDLAGLSNDAACEIDPIHTRNINIDGACHLVQTAIRAGVSRYIYSSSASVYGHGEKIGLTESDPVNPLTEYAISKMSVEKFLHGEKKLAKGFHPVILRNATVFGFAPRMRFDLAVNVMAARAMLKGSIYVMGGGDQWRPLVHVDDVVNNIAWFLEHASYSHISGQVFNIGSASNQMKIRALAGRVANAFPQTEIHVIPDDVDERSYHLSFDKLRLVRPEAKFLPIENGIWQIKDALRSGRVSFDDPSTITVKWYSKILEWDKRLSELKINGRLL